jgi:transcriptional regulator with XRE-family HTH domain
MYRRMKDLREDGDLRQKDIAGILNISRSAYANYERGERDMYGQTLEKLADFYETSVDYIMGRTDVRKAYPKGRRRGK